MLQLSIYFQLWWCSTPDPETVLILLGGGSCLCSDRDYMWKMICARVPILATGERRCGLDWKWLLTFYHGYELNYNE